MEELRSSRLRLRGWRPDDVDFLFDLYSRWEVQRHIGLVPRVMTDRAEAQERLDRLAAHPQPDPLGVWAVAREDDGRLLGVLLLKSIPASGTGTPAQPSGDVEIGWHFHPDAWGHGYATEAAALVLGRALEAGLPRVVAVTHPENTASQAVCRRIGMVHQGRTDRYYDATCELFTATRD
ncbi:GNAT family N-acetyltransferase [Modestobacter sp. L9-4]|uniref:GNAT family N-acetyltransferase n=1 Tax=Modestobacter sp. L9-4 TaxID=2851567 RepID=UPI001C75ACCF|nr:GNAT family N-acetyltransferase [Modestobacter sp. L9-4]QXG76893.1 GNAT family N-acetyltransferase [Modestobacter sp. L9-4]